ncbi:MAG: type II secretion system protein GspJ [Bdellovibrionota bacterium]
MKEALSQKAFTLIELMVSLAILAAISLATSRSLRSTAQLKNSLQGRIDRQATFRSAIRLIKRDIHLAFNHHDLTIDILKDIKSREKELLSANNNNNNNTNNNNNNSTGTNPQDPSTDPSSSGNQNNNSSNNSANSNQSNVSLFNLEDYEKEIKDPTSFIGEKDELHFTNTNNIRISPDDLSSSQQEVGYFIKNCRNRLNPELSYNCLWRRTNKSIDDDVTQGGNEFVVLENVTVFKLRYFGEGKEDWQENWYSTNRGDDSTKDKFPDAVEVSIAFKQNDKLAEAVFVAKVAFPNNPEKKEENNLTSPGQFQ